MVRGLRARGFVNILTAGRSDLDLLSPGSVDNFFKKSRPKFVFLAAARVGGIKANIRYPVEFLTENLGIQNNLLMACLRYEVKKLCFFASSCLYPRDCPQPMKEENILSGPFEPTNEGYAIAKLAGIRLVQYLHQQYGLQGINLVPCNLYGPNETYDLEKAHVISALVRRFTEAADQNLSDITLWGSGEARRETMHVDDLAAAALHLMQAWNSSDPINVGWGIDFSIVELANMIAEATGFRGNILWDRTQPDGMPRKCMDVSKMKATGFEPRIELEDGLKEKIVEYRSRRLAGQI